MTTNQQQITHPPTGPGAVPDLTSYRGIHAAIRASDDRLVAGLDALSTTRPDIDTARAIFQWFAGFRGELDVHHRIEDDIYFPELAIRVPSYADYAAMLDADHARLDELLDSLVGALGRLASGASWISTRATALELAVELRDLMLGHLEVEDRDILPMFERHFCADEYRSLDEAALRFVTPRQALFTVPWFMATAPADAVERTWAAAPPALKVVHFLARRRYARLVKAAFGHIPSSACVVRTRP